MEDSQFQHIGEEISLAWQTIQAGVWKRMQRLKAVKINGGQCCDLVHTFSSGVRESFKVVEEVLDLLADPETRQSASEVTRDTTNIPESSTSQNRCKASRWRMQELCLYSLAELDRCLEMGEAYQSQCSDVHFWRTALRMSIGAPNPSGARLHTELSCIFREFAWSVDVIQLAFTAFKVLLLTGMDPLQQDVAFEWCARSCRVVLNRIGKYHIFQENHSVLESNSVQDSDEKELLRMLKEIAGENPWFPSAHRSKIASFLRQKVEGPAPRTDYLPTTFQIDHLDIHMKNFLDDGSFASVAQCEWQGEMVAVKYLKVCNAEARKTILDKEVALLASVQHPNIVQLIGFAYKEEPNTCMIVMELMPMNLHNLICKNRKNCIEEGTVPEFQDDSTPFPLDVAIHILLQIAEGMCHLRSLRVMHRDLKAVNILVNQHHHGRSHPSEARCDVQNERESFYHVKLADFGTSKSQPLVSKFRTKEGTSCWMAPEVLEVESNSGHNSSEYTWSADVYSFGITCSEVLTGLLPFQDISRGDLLSIIRSGERPPLPRDCPAQLRKLIYDCWATDPESRPEFVEIRERLWQCRFEMLLNDDKILRRKSFRDKLRAMSSSLESQGLGDGLRHAFSASLFTSKSGSWKKFLRVPILRPNEMNVATTAGPSLQNDELNIRLFLSAISTEKRLWFQSGNGDLQCCYNDRAKNFVLNVDLQHDAYVQVTSAIASSRTLTKVWLDLGPDIEAAKGVALVEEFGTAIASNHKVESVDIQARNVPLDPILAKFSEVLLESPLMTSLQLCSLADHGVVSTTAVEKFAFALHKHGPLQHLSIAGGAKIGSNWLPFLCFMGGEGSNHVLDYLWLCQAGIDNKGAKHIASMICRNTSLRFLELRSNEIGAEGVVHISKALHSNSSLRGLDVSGNPIGAVGLKALVAALTPNAEGIQANTSLTSLHISGCEIEDEGIEHLEVLVRKNNTLLTLGVGHSPLLKDAKNVIKLLESLKTNKSLTTLNMIGCSGVVGRTVLGTILDVLQVNHHIEKIDISDTPLYHDGGTNIVQAQLELMKHDRVWEGLSGMATVKPNSARVFLCGYPYAGKTTLRKSIMRRSNITSESGSWKKFLKVPILRPEFCVGKPKAPMLSHMDIEERTRGIEVHSMSVDNILITMWDMAGHEEYHSFHDLVVPNLIGGGSACSFLLVCNLMREVRFQESLVKSSEEIEEEILYWLRFIASNTRISASYRPHVIIVLTNCDCLDFQTSESIRGARIDDKIDKLRTKFEDVLEIDAKRFLVDARSDEATFPLFNAMKEHLKELLGRLPMVFEACAKMQAIIAEWNQEHPKEPLLRWDIFANMCDKVEELRGDGVDSEVVKTKKQVVATSLHDGGQLIYYRDLDFVILNPHWFCHDIIGRVIKCKELDAFDGITNGTITKRDLKNVVIASLHNKLQGYSFEELLQMMVKLELCYEQDVDRIFIPTMLQDDKDLSALGERQLEWPSKKNQRNYVGRRLMCSDESRTILTLGFFPRLQVVLQREFGRKEGESTYKLEKNLISFIRGGMEVIVEYSGQIGFDIDILVQSSIASEDAILEFVLEDVMSTIITLCAHPTLGCQGVKLEEAIIRPECVKALVPRVHRKHQVVSVEELKQIVLATGDLKYVHNWREEGGTLGRGCEEVKILLGKKAWESLLQRHLEDLQKIRKSNSLQAPKKSNTVNCDLQEDEFPEPSSIRDLSKLVKRVEDRLGSKMKESEANILESLREMEDRINGKLEKIADLQEVLLPELCTKFDELMTYSVELQQSQVPRLVCFSAGQENHFRKIVTRMVPGLKNLHLHLMCEHKAGFHIVKNQNGCPVSFGNDGTQVCNTLMVEGLRVLIMLAKVGAHLAAGMEPKIPDLPKDFMLVLDTPGFLDSWELPHIITTIDGRVELIDRLVTPVERKTAELWLIDFLKWQNIRELFLLQKVMYKVSGEGRGSMAWVCEEHMREGKENHSLEVLPSG